jgi:hypothetical protein
MSLNSVSYITTMRPLFLEKSSLTGIMEMIARGMVVKATSMYVFGQATI